MGLIRSELRKLTTTRLWWGLLLGLAVTSAALAGLTGAIAGLPGPSGEPTPGVEDAAVVRGVYTAGLGVAYLFALALGVIAIAGEHRHGTITFTVLAAPRRLRIVVTKIIAVLTIGVGYGVATVAAGLLVGVPLVALRGGPVRLGGDGVPRALVLAVLAVALWTLIGLGVGTLIRNQVVALLVSIGIAWIAEPLVAVALNALDVGAVARLLPSQATTAIVEPSTAGGFGEVALLPWWAGALTLAGYALVAAGLGAGLTLRRDIT
jgi:ABC-type transport system involved in multi-copper enzyme maturation permease subunit